MPLISTIRAPQELLTGPADLQFHPPFRFATSSDHSGKSVDFQENTGGNARDFFLGGFLSVMQLMHILRTGGGQKREICEFHNCSTSLED